MTAPTRGFGRSRRPGRLASALPLRCRSRAGLLATAYVTFPTNLEGPARFHQRSTRSIPLLRTQKRCENERIQIDLAVTVLDPLIGREEQIGHRDG